MCQVIPFTHPSKAYADLTGRFPYKSSRGNQYILVFYNYDANYINAIAVKSRQASELKNAFVSHTDTLRRSGIVPTMYILDNEISNNLKLALTKYGITYQLVPPAQHRRNAAERAIRTFKNHFLSGLASLPPSFPISEWDRLLEQALLTLNLLRNARKIQSCLPMRTFMESTTSTVTHWHPRVQGWLRMRNLHTEKHGQHTVKTGGTSDRQQNTTGVFECT